MVGNKSQLARDGRKIVKWKSGSEEKRGESLKDVEPCEISRARIETDLGSFSPGAFDVMCNPVQYRRTE